MREPNPYHSSRSCVSLPTDLRYHLSRLLSTSSVRHSLSALFSFWKILNECPLTAPLFDLSGRHALALLPHHPHDISISPLVVQYYTRSKRELRWCRSTVIYLRRFPFRKAPLPCYLFVFLFERKNRNAVSDFSPEPYQASMARAKSGTSVQGKNGRWRLP